MKLRYFAWVRERIGTGHEIYEGTAQTISEVIVEISQRSPAHELVFSDTSTLRFALDETLAELDAPLENARELAIFPPMTGG